MEFIAPPKKVFVLKKKNFKKVFVLKKKNLLHCEPLIARKRARQGKGRGAGGAWLKSHVSPARRPLTQYREANWQSGTRIF